MLRAVNKHVSWSGLGALYARIPNTVLYNCRRPKYN